MNEKLKKAVFQNLLNAKDGGYWDGMRGAFPLKEESDAHIAQELISYAADMEDYSVEELLPHITAFRLENE